MLGVVGGLSSIVWGTLMILSSGYQSFKLNTSFIGAIYPTSPTSKNSAYTDNLNESEALREYKATRAMVSTVTERSQYFYTFSEYVITSMLNLACFTCCFRG